ncbi:MAG: acyl-CoA dehydrogenase, partial [Proteobacteria bacterium]|nr:acyl-CoA dehydrogenase [Pseudomonadota bacterium]
MSGFPQFDETDAQRELRDAVRRFLARACPPAVVRDALEGRVDQAKELWRGLAEMGCLGARIPEAFGGLGLGAAELGLIAHDLGRVLAPSPTLSTLYMSASLIEAAGSAAQKADLLAAIAQGRLRASVADIELDGRAGRQAVTARVVHGRLFGAKALVADGLAADRFLVLAREGKAPPSLFLVAGDAEGVSRTEVATIDPSRPYARLAFDGVIAEPLGAPGTGQALLERARDNAAVFVACEQVGGAERALELACDHARERFAFGRPIGSFQAVKHLLADMYASLAIARANVKRALWALDTNAPDVRQAAARAYLSASHAFRHCSADAIQVHGGAGFMWASDQHLFYRRAHLLSRALGAPQAWERRLIPAGRNAAAVAAQTDDEAAAAFRRSARDWIVANAPWPLKPAIDRSPPGALRLEGDRIAAQKAWQKKKYEGGWACLAWPQAYGGRGATPLERI